MSNELTTQKQKFSVAITTDTYKTLINNTLGDPERSRRFIAAITSAVAVNPDLQECTPGTILAGALLGESLNLSPSPQLGQYYLVPFKKTLKGSDGKTLYILNENGEHVLDEKGKWKAQTVTNATFVMGYKGYIQMAIRTNQYKDLDVLEIRDGEYLGRDPDTGKPRFRFIESDEDRYNKKVVGYLAYFEMLNGFKKTLFWSKSKMLNHADKYSPAFSAQMMLKIEKGEVPQDQLWKYSSYWYTDFDGMAKKTMLRQLLDKWGVMSADMQQAFVNDSSVIRINEDGSFTGENADTVPDEIIVDEPAPTNQDAISLKDL